MEGSFGIARKNKSTEGDMWSLPLDPTLVRSVRATMQDTVIDPELREYLDQLMKHQRAVDESTRDHSIEHPHLWGFQKPSVKFLETAGRCVLGHQMGTGKTVIACAALDYLRLRKVLIVCPNSWSWASHISQWVEDPSTVFILQAGSSNKGKLEWDEEINSYVFSGSRDSREDFLKELLLTENEFLLITNFNQMTIHKEVLSKAKYDVCVVDEAHRLKNHGSQRSRASRTILPLADFRWLLTGTPIRRGYEDLWALLHICDPNRFPSYWNFVKIYFRTVPNYWGSLDIIGPRDEYAFNRMLSTYMFRKTKQEVMPELPDKIIEEVKLPMTEEQERLYRQMEKDFRVLVRKELEEGKDEEQIIFAPNVAAQLTRLRQLCLSPALLEDSTDSAKLHYVNEFLEDFKEQDEKLLIFTYFRQFVPLVERTLKAHEIPYALFVGGMGQQQGRKIEEMLNKDQVKVVVGTIGAMGEFLNLQAASQVIFCDRSWSQKENEQAEDRVHRGEIKTSPVIRYLYHPKTVDQDIVAVCNRKQKMEDETVNRIEVIRSLLRRE